MTKAPPEIAPSPEARQLFNAIHARASDVEIEGIEKPLRILDYDGSLRLTMDRLSDGHEGHRDVQSVRELIREGWIAPSDDGGIVIAL